MNVLENQNTIVAPTAAKFARDVVVAFSISLIIFASSQTRIPFYPVPFTLQTLAIPILCLFSSRKHMLQGLSLFTTYRILQSGAGLLLTSGYILGFFSMVLILTPNVRIKNTSKLALRLCAAEFVVLLFGTIVLAMFIGLKQAFVGGFMFFIAAEIFKSAIVLGVHKLLNISKDKTVSTER